MNKLLVKSLMVVVLLLTLQSCVRNNSKEIKSPCVGGKNSPCDVRFPINTWLEKERA